MGCGLDWSWQDATKDCRGAIGDRPEKRHKLQSDRVGSFSPSSKLFASFDLQICFLPDMKSLSALALAGHDSNNCNHCPVPSSMLQSDFVQYKGIFNIYRGDTGCGVALYQRVDMQT